MRRLTPVLILLFLSAFWCSAPQAAFWRSDDTLLSVDGTKYTSADFKRWWGFWNDEGLSAPKSIDPYLDWLLLVREGERMELASDPSVQRQAKVFLTSRALLLLKHEAVDSQIEVTEADVRARYDERYTPRWLVQRLRFKDEASTAEARRVLADGSLTLEELLGRSMEEGGPMHHREDWLRPAGIDRGWAELFRDLGVGELVEPARHGEGVMLYRLKDRKGGDDEDLATVRRSIERDLWKERESALTLEMLDGLRRKFEVKVDEERLAAVDLDAPDDALTDDVLIATNRQNVTVRDFVQIARKDMAMRLSGHGSAEEEAKMHKGRIVAGIIAQNVTNWESLDRRFQDREPFKWEFEFHVRHRIAGAVEERLFAPKAAVSEAEVKEHYEKNLHQYTSPETAKLIILDDTQGPVDKVWTELVTGKSFRAAVREHFGKELPSQEVPVNHLDPAVKAVVEKLARGDTSQPFTALGSPGKPVPLEQAGPVIRNKLVRERMDRERKEYLDLLKARSKIEVKAKKWAALQKELGEGK
jgi:hypothetical protein